MRVALRRQGGLPVILAGEAAECGLACMAMVGRFYGHDIDLGGLRRRFSVSITGISLRGLTNMASSLDLAARALRVEMDALSRLRLPAILHWDLGHFVVLKSAGKRGIVIHDPSRGLRRMSLSEASKHFTGVALELSPVADFRQVTSRFPLRINSLWSRITGLWSAAGRVLFLSLTLQALAFATPLLIQVVADEAITDADLRMLGIVALGFGVISVLQSAVTALRDWSVQVLGNTLNYQVMGNLIHHLLKLPVSFFEKRDVGDILSRLGSTLSIQDTLARGALSTVVDGSMALFAVAIMFGYSIRLTFVVVVALGVNTLVSLVFYGPVRAKNEEFLVASAVERSHLMESIRAAATIKLLGKETQREGAWRNLYSKATNANYRSGLLQIANDQILSAVTGVSFVLVVYVGALQVIEHRGLSIGMLLAYLSYRQILSDRTTALIGQVMKFRLLSLHLERISDIVTSDPEEISALPYDSGVARGAIELLNVSFRYGDADPLILKSVNLSVRDGEFLAITGPSGGGKTTLLKTMLGVLAPTEGKVLLDGDLADASRFRAWREHVGVVSQDDRLLSGTIAENISFFDLEPDDARIRDAASAARISDDIERMPMKYMSLIGDMGSALSGGQRQRILLARALYRRPNILVLDEGTANLDEATETLIADLIAGMAITRIVVAHRPTLLLRASRTVVVEGNTVVERAAPPILSITGEITSAKPVHQKAMSHG